MVTLFLSVLKPSLAFLYSNYTAKILEFTRQSRSSEQKLLVIMGKVESSVFGCISETACIDFDYFCLSRISRNRSLHINAEYVGEGARCLHQKCSGFQFVVRVVLTLVATVHGESKRVRKPWLNYNLGTHQLLSADDLACY